MGPKSNAKPSTVRPTNAKYRITNPTKYRSKSDVFTTELFLPNTTDVESRATDANPKQFSKYQHKYCCKSQREAIYGKHWSNAKSNETTKRTDSKQSGGYAKISKASSKSKLQTTSHGQSNTKSAKFATNECTQYTSNQY